MCATWMGNARGIRSISFFHWEPHVHSTPRAPRSRGLHSRTEPRRRPRRLDRRPRGGRAGRHPRTRWTRSKRSTGPSSQGRSSATRQAGGIFSRLWRGRDLLRSQTGVAQGNSGCPAGLTKTLFHLADRPEAGPIPHPRDSVSEQSELYLSNRAPFSTNSGARQPRRTTGLRHRLHAMRRNLIGEHATSITPV